MPQEGPMSVPLERQLGLYAASAYE